MLSTTIDFGNRTAVTTLSRIVVVGCGERGFAVNRYGKLLKWDQYIGTKAIYWRLTVCRMTRYRRVKIRKGEKIV
jgi:hypothetical protein